MTCAGSLFFDLPPQPTNPAAEEGTAAGEFLAHLLTKPLSTAPTRATNGRDIDSEMHFFIKPIAEEIASRAQDGILCEQRIDWKTRSGILISGSYDISYVHAGKLYIEDLKYGYGIVEVKENWQLIAYAIGEVIRRNQYFDRIVMKIQQPRPHHEDGPAREWEITYEQLLEYKEQIEKRMDQIAAGFSELVTSSKCKYCPATAEACTAFNRAVFHGIDHVLSHASQDKITEKEIAHQLDLLDRTTEILKIKYDSLKQLAVDRMNNGGLIPGYMSEPSYGDRKWKKEVSPEVIKTLTGKDITETIMLSPAKAEKVGVPKDLVKNFVDRHFIGNKLVRKDVTALGNKIFGNPINQ